MYHCISVSLTVSIDIGTEHSQMSFFISSTRLAEEEGIVNRTFSSYATETGLQVRDSPELRQFVGACKWRIPGRTHRISISAGPLRIHGQDDNQSLLASNRDA